MDSISNPISENSPVGEEYKHEDEYLEVEIEIEKSFNVASENKIDWMFVTQRCEKILRENAKDLKIASYWLYGKWQIESQTNFLDAFESYVALIEEYNKALFPKRGKRKIKILEWVEKVIEQQWLTQLDQYSEELLHRLLKIFASLDNAVPIMVEDEKQKFLDDIKHKCKTLLEAAKYKKEQQKKQAELDRIAEERRKAEEQAEKEASALRRSEEEEVLAKFKPSYQQPEAKTFATVDELTHDEIEKVIDSTLDICSELLEKSHGDYLALKILLSLGELLWEEALRDSEVVTDDFMPSKDISMAVNELIESQVSLSHLVALEEQLLIRPTWLEGYFLMTRILYKLGKTEDAEQLEDALFYFLSRCTELEEYTVGKNEKIISEKMSLWIQNKILSHKDDGNSSIEYQRAYQEVMQIRKEQNEQNALNLLEEYYRKASSEEEKFRWRLVFVDFALEIGDKNLALALLLDLERIIDKYRIDLWQPELAINTYEILLKPILTQELDAEAKERIYKKLSILDIQKVIKL